MGNPPTFGAVRSGMCEIFLCLGQVDRLVRETFRPPLGCTPKMAAMPTMTTARMSQKSQSMVT